ncbi:sulfotransferase family protein [Flindersiella endophytica]
MKVIGAGFGRTGTMSLKVALERLGFGPCYHMSEIFEHPEHAERWVAAAKGEISDWDDVLGGYEATTDWPGAKFWRELMDAYPEAKVLLNVRDPERWYTSVENSFLAMRRQMPEGEFQVPPPQAEMMRLIMGDTFGHADEPMGGIADKDHAIEVFQRHNESVRQAVPAERLLEYEVKQGWEPLCAFLEVPVPAEPFPHLNDSASFQKMVSERLSGTAGDQAATGAT